MHGPSCPPVYAPLGAPGQPDPSAASTSRWRSFWRGYREGITDWRPFAIGIALGIVFVVLKVLPT
jgi:hypothetical protein